MRKNCFLMLLALAFTAYSCRNDYLPDQAENYNNSGSFQLTSQRISLDDSKHKAHLLPELEKAEAGLKAKIKSNVLGKVIDYGDGVSIDTDHVIYIENGPDYHTYTFKINRENAPENAPLENLLLSPLPDGSYQEFLVTYHLTAQEREKIRNAEPVNTKGKTIITELAKGSFNSGGQLAKMTCNWTEETIWQGCSHIVKGQSYHNASNVADWPNCTADVKPSVYTIITGGCITEQPEVIDYPGGPGSGTGPGGGGNTAPGTLPDDCIAVAGNPGEVGMINPDGCNTGMPTLPNIPPKVNPCEKIMAESNKAKELLAKPKANGRLDEVKVNISTHPNEKSFSLGVDSNGNEQVTGIFEDFSGTQTNIVAQSSSFKVKAGVHTHSPSDLAGPSFADAYTFINANSINNDFDYYYTIAYDGNEYVYTITNQYLFEKFTGKYPPSTYIDFESMSWNLTSSLGIEGEKVAKSFRKQGKSKNESYDLALAFILKKYNAGIGISKRDTNGDFKPIFVEELPDPDNPKRKTYQQTNNCNL